MTKSGSAASKEKQREIRRCSACPAFEIERGAMWCAWVVVSVSDYLPQRPIERFIGKGLQLTSKAG